MNHKKTELREYEEKLCRLKEQLTREVENAPMGRLRIAKKSKHVEYYYCNEGVGTSGIDGKYLQKKNETLIRQLAQKDYDSKLLREVFNQLKKLERYPYDLGIEKLTDIFEDLPDTRKQLVIPRITPTSVRVAEWLEMPYEAKGFSEGEPEIYTENKERVRSKSEKLIADKLKLMGIPYKYECPIKLAGYGVVYPDFTILNKHTMEVVWLEHCGKMADPEYTTKMVAKIHSYERTGIYVGKNLYLTFETLLAPFDAGCIETIFQQFA